MQTNPLSSDKDDFEILLNLLASDGIEEPSNGIKPDLGRGARDRSARSDGNSSGRKLDFNRIRSFYQQSNYRGGGEGLVYADQPIETETTREVQGRHDNDGTDQIAEVSDSTIGHLSRSLPDDDVLPCADDEVSRSGSVLGYSQPLHYEREPGKTMKLEEGQIDPSLVVPNTLLDESAGHDAKQLLCAAASALGLPKIDGLFEAGVADWSLDYRPATVFEIRKALEFVAKVDELVWRRSVFGAATPVFNPHNMDALLDRIKLWERISRSHKY